MRNIVVIPIYKEMPDETELMSLRQCVKVLGGHGICFVCPKSLDVTPYTLVTGDSVCVERFDGRFFWGIEGYNDLLKNRDFYKCFKTYEYILIYQLDAWVFEDKLDYWCDKGYDYIGAPWFEDWCNHEDGKEFFCVGNGGFSLRRVSRFLTATDVSQKLYGFRQFVMRKQWRKGRFLGMLKEFLSGPNRLGTFMASKKDRWEDVFFCCDLQGTRLELNTPSCSEAALFSIETSPKYIFNEVNHGQLPFGCHAWRRYEYEEFWKDIIHEF